MTHTLPLSGWLPREPTARNIARASSCSFKCAYRRSRFWTCSSSESFLVNSTGVLFEVVKRKLLYIGLPRSGSRLDRPCSNAIPRHGCRAFDRCCDRAANLLSPYTQAGNLHTSNIGICDVMRPAQMIAVESEGSLKTGIDWDPFLPQRYRALPQPA